MEHLLLVEIASIRAVRLPPSVSPLYACELGNSELGSGLAKVRIVDGRILALPDST